MDNAYQFEITSRADEDIRRRVKSFVKRMAAKGYIRMVTTKEIGPQVPRKTMTAAQQIWNLMDVKKGATVAELVEVTGVSSSRIGQLLHRLEAEGEVYRIAEKNKYGGRPINIWYRKEEEENEA